MDAFTRRGTIGGTLTIVFASISHAELLETVLLSMLGAIVSFSVSVLLRWLMRKRKPPDE